jgi:hypothetical protein
MDSVRAAIESAGNKTETPEEKHRAEQDLAAQLVMAKAARQMFWVGVAENVITLAGVLLVLATLIYTRHAAKAAQAAVTEAKEATKAAREIGEAQVRAYLHCEGAKFFILTGGIFSCHPKIRNTGQSPAKNIRIEASCRMSRETGGVPLLSRTYWECEREYCVVPPISAQQSESGNLNFPAITGVDDRSLLEDFRYLSVDCLLIWEDVFERENAIAFKLLAEDGQVAGEGQFRQRIGKMSARHRTPMTEDEWKREEEYWASQEPEGSSS